MKYLKVIWHHSSPDEPILLYSELDDARWDLRKVEIFSDGTRGYAGGNYASTTTCLGNVPLPTIEEIASDAQFEPSEISAEEFESAWQEATQLN